jgi:hypothetical protein
MYTRLTLLGASLVISLRGEYALVNSGPNYEGLKVATPCLLIVDLHERVNETSTVPTFTIESTVWTKGQSIPTGREDPDVFCLRAFLSRQTYGVV